MDFDICSPSSPTTFTWVLDRRDALSNIIVLIIRRENSASFSIIDVYDAFPVIEGTRVFRVSLVAQGACSAADGVPTYLFIYRCVGHATRDT